MYTWQERMIPNQHVSSTPSTRCPPQNRSQMSNFSTSSLSFSSKFTFQIGSKSNLHQYLYLPSFNRSSTYPVSSPVAPWVPAGLTTRRSRLSCPRCGLAICKVRVTICFVVSDHSNCVTTLQPRCPTYNPSVSSILSIFFPHAST